MPTDYVRTTPTALRQACRDWREPLAESILIERLNPFTRQNQTLPSWDPDPKAAAPSFVADPPGNSLEMDGFEGAGANALIRLFFAADADARIAVRRRPSLIGPEDGPWVLDVPASAIAHLAALTNAEVEAAGPRWAALVRAELKAIDPNSDDLLDDGFYGATLVRLATFAREAEAANENVYEWISPD
jgi:hypothetical protein